MYKRTSHELLQSFERARQQDRIANGSEPKDFPSQKELFYDLVTQNSEVGNFFADYAKLTKLERDRLNQQTLQQQQHGPRETCPKNGDRQILDELAGSIKHYWEEYDIPILDSVCMLHSLFLFGDDEYKQMLYDAGIEEVHFKQYITHNKDLLKKPVDGQNRQLAVPEDNTNNEQHAQNSDSTLAKYCHELTDHEQAPAIGRDNEIETMMITLNRQEKNNPVLLGEAGVGKSAIVNELARRIKAEEAPSQFRNARIFKLDTGALVAGTTLRGEFEERVKKTLEELGQLDNPILYIDEIHNIIGAGLASGTVMDMSNMLKEVLAEGKISVVGATTNEEYKRHIEPDPALDRRFNCLNVEEPELDQAAQMAARRLEQYADKHGVEFEDGAAHRAAYNVAVHFGGALGRNPDKAVEILDTTASRVALGIKTSTTVSTNGKKQKTPFVTLQEIDKTSEQLRGLPEGALTLDDTSKILNLDENLNKHVYGQEDPISHISTTLQSNLALGDAKTPNGAFILAGKTGVGKTEITKALGTSLDMGVIRFDMSEYMNETTANRFIGAAPGYVGYKEGGALVDAVRNNPRSVIVFDELEKAHPKVQDLLLHIIDEGEITDGRGRRASCGHNIICATTNAGANKSDIAMGFTEGETQLGKELKESFKPELLGRCTLLVFNDISQRPDIQQSVVEKKLNELNNRLKSKWSVSAEFSDAIKRWLVDNGALGPGGGRDVDRLVTNTVQAQLSEPLLRGDIPRHSHIHVDMGSKNKDRIMYKITQSPTTEKKHSNQRQQACKAMPG